MPKYNLRNGRRRAVDNPLWFFQSFKDDGIDGGGGHWGTWEPSRRECLATWRTGSMCSAPLCVCRDYWPPRIPPVGSVCFHTNGSAIMKKGMYRYVQIAEETPFAHPLILSCSAISNLICSTSTNMWEGHMPLDYGVDTNIIFVLPVRVTKGSDPWMT